MKMGIKVLECKLISANKGVEVKHLKESIDQGIVDAWKFVGNNKKGFSPVNIPNQPIDCLVLGIRPVYGPAIVGQSNKTKDLPVAAWSIVNFVFFDLMYDMKVPN